MQNVVTGCPGRWWSLYLVQSSIPQKPPRGSVAHFGRAWADGIGHDCLQRPNQPQPFGNSVIHGEAESNRTTIFLSIFLFGVMLLKEGETLGAGREFFTCMKERKLSLRPLILLAFHVNNCGPKWCLASTSGRLCQQYWTGSWFMWLKNYSRVISVYTITIIWALW